MPCKVNTLHLISNDHCHTLTFMIQILTRIPGHKEPDPYLSQADPETGKIKGVFVMDSLLVWPLSCFVFVFTDFCLHSPKNGSDHTDQLWVRLHFTWETQYRPNIDPAGKSVKQYYTKITRLAHFDEICWSLNPLQFTKKLIMHGIIIEPRINRPIH